ncbi:MAG: hypothetical protein M1820_010186 [Bogoriella megaspora]|nr:MAG: hypothetical protein M1820_010186 [Bogoriella megaspora]
MCMNGFSLFAITFAIGLVGLALAHVFQPVDQQWMLKRTKWRLPPGPAGTPVVGNLLQFFEARDAGNLAAYLRGLGDYGEMTTLHMGSRTWVLLNGNRVIFDIIVKHGKITTERPYMPVASGLVSNNMRTVVRQTAQWMEGRRVMHHLLSGSVLRTYGDWQECESIRLLHAYLDEPHAWYAHHYRYATAVLYRLVMGDKLSKSKAELDEYQKVTVEFIFSLNRSVVDFFPALAKLPTIMQTWRPYWESMGKLHRSVFQKWWDPVAAAVQAGTANPSFVRDTLLHPETRYGGSYEEGMYLATSVLAAGGDNTRMTLNTFVMAMISYPNELRRAQDEVDRVCGSDTNMRLPCLADMDRLPYFCAMIKEVLRWRPTVPLVPQHHLTEELEYGEYLFPPGTDFLINNIALEAQACKDSNQFLPERWLDGTEANVVQGFWGFGGGRRICVGYKVAQQALFVAYVRIVFCFDIAPNGQFDDRALNHGSLGEPFPAKMTARSAAHRALILKEMTRVEG